MGKLSCENHVLQDDLQIMKDAILSSPKNPVIAHLNLNSLRNKINDLRILIQDIPLNYFILRNKTRQRFRNCTVAHSWVRNKS